MFSRSGGLYSRWARNVAFMKERRGAYRVLMGKPEIKRSL